MNHKSFPSFAEGEREGGRTKRPTEVQPENASPLDNCGQLIPAVGSPGGNLQLWGEAAFSG
jgi:hypothetical protein